MKKVFKRVSIVGLNLLTLGTFVSVCYLARLNSQLPNVANLNYVELSQPLKIYDRDNKLLVSYGDQRRLPISYSAIPPMLTNAIVAVKDSNFHNHRGAYFSGIFNQQTEHDAQGAVLVQGPSISQSLAMEYFAEKGQDTTTLTSGIKSALLSYQIERSFTKQEILTLVTNKVYLGNKTYGFEAGAQTYFNKSLRDLSLGELTFLVAIAQSPSKNDPEENYDNTLAERTQVLNSLRHSGLINQEEYQEALSSRPKIRSAYRENNAAYATEIARQAMYKNFGERAYRDGFEVYLTISKDEQNLAQLLVRSKLIAEDKSTTYRGIVGRAWPKGMPLPQGINIPKILAHTPTYPPLFPVVVTNVNDNGIRVENIYESEMDIPSAKLSKAFKNGDKQREVADVYSPGDIIYLNLSHESPNFERSIDLECQQSGYDPFKNDQEYLSISQIPTDIATFVSLDSRNGAVQAIVGGFSLDVNNTNYAIEPEQEIGSVIKPFVLAYGLSSKENTISTLYQDQAIEVKAGDDASKVLWTAKNFDDKYNPQGITLRSAIGKNVNTVPLVLTQTLGIEGLTASLSHVGFMVPDNVSMRLPLGELKASPLQVARAYAVIDNGGFLINPYIVDRVVENDKVVYTADKPTVCEKCDQKNVFANLDNQSVGEKAVVHSALLSSIFDLSASTSKNAPRVMDADIAYIVRDVLRTNITGNSDFKGHASVVASGFAGSKRSDYGAMLGIDQKQETSWLAGYAGQFASAGYVYNAKGIKGTPVTATEMMAPIWNSFNRVTFSKYPSYNIRLPSSLSVYRIDLATGIENKRGGANEYYIAGTHPIMASVTTSQPQTRTVYVTKTVTTTKQVAAPVQPAPKPNKQYKSDGTYNDDEFNFYGDD
ncbi:transglycosylase domain-containing protein [Psittacicella hinzii]|uniref:Penicillin-binding protein 1A n=1 Tax=Psittacicella hinzii TaxID=2028575 RepID=A0A3A1YNG3_9GAMM|nr:transglycosylase domain-containing protein [Psittacicella hinzii]RIY39091.1 hypothetical protein CKF58_02855 [Psittacicella hinzii]